MRQLVRKIKYGTISPTACLGSAFVVLFLLSAALVLAFARPFPVMAAETGSITLSLPESAAGVTMTLYQVAAGEQDSFTVSGEFADSGIVISSMNDADGVEKAAEQLAAWANTNGISGASAQVSADGTVSFGNLSDALYLIVQSSGTEKIVIQKVIVPIPYLADGTSSYHASLTPKYEIPTGAVILNKTDDSGAAVSGAVFSLQKKTYIGSDGTMASDLETGQDVNGRYYWEDVQTGLVTDENGQIAVSPLVFGMYRFVETEVPSGFVQGPVTVFFEISEAGTVVQENGLYTAGSGNVQQLTALNTRTQVTINKVDEAGAAVAGAKLVIKDSDGNVIHKEDGTAKYGITTSEASDILYQLPAGTYYLSEVTEPDGYRYTADVMFTVSEEEGAENTVTMVDPAVSTPAANSSSGSETDEPSEGSLTVTKELELQNGSATMAENAVFYVALFSDETCATRVSGVKSITFANMGSSSVTFEHLDLGTSYYVAETDEFGEVLTSGMTSDGVVYAPEYPDGTVVKLSKKNADGSITFKNVFYELPSGYYYGGYLTITKKTVRGGEAYDTDDVFYAKVFSDAALTEAASDVIELNMGGGSSFSYTIEVSAGTGVGTSETYYVAETDSSGTPLTDTAAYGFTISIDQESVTISADDSEKTVTITNTFEADEETEGGTEASVTTTSDGSSGETGETTASSVQTGDETPLGRYLALMLAALAVLLAAGVVWRQRLRR